MCLINCPDLRSLHECLESFLWSVNRKYSVPSLCCHATLMLHCNLYVCAGCSGKLSALFWLMEGITVSSWQLVGEHNYIQFRYNCYNKLPLDAASFVGHQRMDDIAYSYGVNCWRSCIVRWPCITGNRRKKWNLRKPEVLMVLKKWIFTYLVLIYC